MNQCKSCVQALSAYAPAIGHHSCLGGCSCYCNLICEGCLEQLKDTVSVVDKYYVFHSIEGEITVLCRNCGYELRQMLDGLLSKVVSFEKGKEISTETYDMEIRLNEKRN